VDGDDMTDGKAFSGRAILLQLCFAVFLGALFLAAPAAAQETPGAGIEAEVPEGAIGVTEQDGMAEAGSGLALPTDLSPWGMFLAADIVVKAVMIGLVFASLVTWTIWFAKRLEISRASRRARAAFATLAAATSLDEAGAGLAKSRGPAALLADAAIQEVTISGDTPEKEGVKERIAWRFQRIEANAAREIGIGTGVLATIGATAPFVGLFGTVWGIMNSFIGIAHTQTTNLAVVAPGIAEALLATGLGLVAAIPAVVIYNSFSRSIAGYRALVADSSAELLRLVSRDLDMGRRPRLAKAAD
jgi:biopolymer transport protein ExbB